MGKKSKSRDKAKGKDKARKKSRKDALRLAVAETEAGAVVVAAPPRGMVLDPTGGQPMTGRLYGPLVKPQALRAVADVVEELEHRMNIDKVQDRVEQLRDQLETTLHNWRESFAPETAEKSPAAKPAPSRRALQWRRGQRRMRRGAGRSRQTRSRARLPAPPSSNRGASSDGREYNRSPRACSAG